MANTKTTTKSTTTKTATKTATKKATENTEIAELRAIIAQMSNTIAELQSSKKEMNEMPSTHQRTQNKKIKVTSLTYGNLSLYAPNRGFLRFQKYGETLTVSYDQLCDYVNACRNAAESGMFYIANPDIVEELDLTEYYKNILTVDVVKGILSDEIAPEDCEDILLNSTKTQKETLGDILIEEVYTGRFANLNKINTISHLLGIDIMKKVGEIQQLQENIEK